MFESLSVRELVDVMTARAREGAVADAQKYAAIAELESRRLSAGAEWEDAAADATDGAAAEISAALNIGHGRALGEIDVATMLRDKFPEVNALFHRGLVSGRRMVLLDKRAYLLVDPAACAELDAALAGRIVGWGPLSEWKFEQLVDAEIGRIDPAAVRKVRESVRDRDFVIGRPDKSGTVPYWGRMRTDAAAVGDTNVARMARSVCPDDPRTLKQRRGDAHAALMAGSTVLKCLCGNPACPAAAVEDAAAASVVVHVYTDQATLDAVTVDPELHGPRTVEGELGEEIEEYRRHAHDDADTAAEEAADELSDVEDSHDEDDDANANADADDDDAAVAEAAEAAASAWRPLAFIPGHGVLPPALLAELVARGATVKPIVTPGGGPEPRYRPSRTMEEFVRWRDLTCRAPGCDRRAQYTDIDHTVPYPAGPTHAGNSKCDCRKHHLIKTFHPGWSETQLADGTVVVTAPTGHVYTTKPGITLLFPGVDVTTPAPPPKPVGPHGPYRSTMMPRRKRTRAQATTDRINAERARNVVVEEPPPF